MSGGRKRVVENCYSQDAFKGTKQACSAVTLIVAGRCKSAPAASRCCQSANARWPEKCQNECVWLFKLLLGKCCRKRRFRVALEDVRVDVLDGEVWRPRAEMVSWVVGMKKRRRAGSGICVLIMRR